MEISQPGEADMLSVVRAVEGWLFEDEALALFDCVRRKMTARASCVVVEVGSWKGRSTIALALALGRPPNGHVFAIDPHTGSQEHRTGGVKVDTYPDFVRNLQVSGVEDVVRPMRMTSHEARPHFGDHSVDVLYIDGSHEYEDVRLDIHDWSSALADGAMAAFNDAFWPGVYKALNEEVTCLGSKYRSPRLVRNTLHFEFRPNAKWTVGDTYALAKLRTLMFLRRHVRRVRRFVPEWLVEWGHGASARWLGDPSQ
jgi:predicted O-methyltransferase YrrM